MKNSRNIITDSLNFGLVAGSADESFAMEILRGVDRMGTSAAKTALWEPVNLLARAAKSKRMGHDDPRRECLAMRRSSTKYTLGSDIADEMENDFRLPIGAVFGSRVSRGDGHS